MPRNLPSWAKKIPGRFSPTHSLAGWREGLQGWVSPTAVGHRSWTSSSLLDLQRLQLHPSWKLLVCFEGKSVVLIQVWQTWAKDCSQQHFLDENIRKVNYLIPLFRCFANLTRWNKCRWNTAAPTLSSALLPTNEEKNKWFNETSSKISKPLMCEVNHQITTKQLLLDATKCSKNRKVHCCRGNGSCAKMCGWKGYRGLLRGNPLQVLELFSSPRLDVNTGFRSSSPPSERQAANSPAALTASLTNRPSNTHFRGSRTLKLPSTFPWLLTVASPPPSPAGTCACCQPGLMQILKWETIFFNFYSNLFLSSSLEPSSYL